MGGPQCRLLILRNGNDPCRYFLNVYVGFKIVQCHLSILRNAPCCVGKILPHVDRLHVTCRF